jgi:hypothetical protein
MPKSERDEILTALVCDIPLIQFCSIEDFWLIWFIYFYFKDISYILGHVGRTCHGLHPAVASRGDAWKNFVQRLQYSVSFHIHVARDHSLNVRLFLSKLISCGSSASTSIAPMQYL